MMLPFLVLLLACTDGALDSGGLPPPELQGHYNSLLTQGAGCTDPQGEPHPEWVADWAQGALEVTGEPDSLTFTFRNDDALSFEGWTDGSWAYFFGGQVEWNGATLDVHHSGQASVEDGRMVLEGDFEAEVDQDEFETNDCTVEVHMVATRIAD